MVFQRAFTLGLGFAVVLCVANSASSDPQTQVEAPASATESVLQKEGALQEILRIREKLGGSVLKGSVLDQPNRKADVPFDAGLRDRLGLPAQAVETTETNVGGAPPKKQSPSEIVATLRKESVELDRIANEIEVLRAYKNADSLRATAKQLRQLARQFDTGKPTSVPGLRLGAEMIQKHK